MKHFMLYGCVDVNAFTSVARVRNLPIRLIKDDSATRRLHSQLRCGYCYVSAQQLLLLFVNIVYRSATDKLAA